MGFTEHIVNNIIPSSYDRLVIWEAKQIILPNTVKQFNKILSQKMKNGILKCKISK